MSDGWGVIKNRGTWGPGWFLKEYVKNGLVFPSEYEFTKYWLCKPSSPRGKISATKRKRAGIVIDARRDRHNMDMQLVTPRVVAMAVAMETMSWRISFQVDLFVVDIEFENLNVEQLNYLTRCVIGRWLLLASKGDLSLSKCKVSTFQFGDGRCWTLLVVV